MSHEDQSPLPTDSTRIKYYLGSILGTARGSVRISPLDPHFCRIEEIKMPAPRSRLSTRGDYLHSAYDAPLYSLIRRTNPEARAFLYAGNDRVGADRGPLFAKNRRESTEPVLLKCLNQDRHWAIIDDYVAFKDKADSVFWRGTTSGWEYRSASRMSLVRRWSSRQSDIDIGLSSLAQEYLLPGVREKWEAYVKGPVSKREFLHHRYVISAEGNDKDSGLAWKLASNSVVMMAKPVCESWLMEPFLQPFVHYVPLHDSYEDLAKQLAWCRGHLEECEQIIRNANRFMGQFRDADKEKEIEEEVVRSYFQKVDAPS